MLKIKDNVDLKELVKYGFNQAWMNGPAYTKKLSGTNQIRGFILVRCEHKINGLAIGNARELDFTHIDSDLYSLEFDELLNTIYDLIKADLVEKVEK